MAKTKISLIKDSREGRAKPWLVRWHGRYDPTAGKQKRYSKSFALKKEAERFIEQLQADFDTGMPRDQKDISLEELCDKFFRTNDNKLMDGTKKLYNDSFQRLLDYFGVSTSPKIIAQEQAEEFLAQIDYIHPYLVNKAKEPSASLRNRICRNCSALFNKAYDWHYIRTNPFSKIGQIDSGDQPWHYFTPEQFNSIITKTKDIKTKGLYAVMYGCGLRLGEAINLLDNGIDIDLGNNRINIVNRTGTKDIPIFTIKDKQARSVPIPHWVSKILIKIQAQAEEGCPFLFLSKNRYEIVQKNWHRYRAAGITSKWKNRNMANNILRDFKVRVRDAGIMATGKVTIHCLRKSWASNLANAGVPSNTLLRMGGWSNIETVLKYYLKSSDENEKKAVRILDRLMGEVEVGGSFVGGEG
jgi:integrase